MSVVALTLDELKKGLPIPASLYKSEIKNYEQKPSKDQLSVNHVFTFEIESDNKDLHGLTIEGRFNSQAMGFVRPFLAALANKPEKQWLDDTAAEMKKKNLQAIPFDGSKAVGQKIGIKIVQKPSVSGGDPYTQVDGYLPYNSVF